MRRPVIAQTNAKYGRDPVVTFYTHISDRYAPFHTKAISSTVRDAPHVLDGLLGHDTDLRIREHYTDISGVGPARPLQPFDPADQPEHPGPPGPP
jgi:TnpA family transposase